MTVSHHFSVSIKTAFCFSSQLTSAPNDSPINRKKPSIYIDLNPLLINNTLFFASQKIVVNSYEKVAIIA